MSSTDRPAILVTGGAGYIGSHACKALAHAGFRPVALDNLSLGHRWAVKWGPLEVLDLHDIAGVIAAIRRHRISAVIHFAASAYVADSMRDPAFYYRNNLLTTLALMDAMRATAVGRLVFSSSCSVYGNPDAVPIDEAHPCRPLSPYGQTKLDCENAVRWYCQAYGLQAIALRYFNAAGADPQLDIGESHHPETRIVPRALLAALGDYPPLEVYGTDFATPDGTAVRDYIHVSDLADAHVKALGVPLSDGMLEVLNLGTGLGASVRQIVQAIEQTTGRPVPHVFGPRRPGDPSQVVADASRASRILNWRAANSDLQVIVRTAWEWYGSQRVSGVAHHIR